MVFNYLALAQRTASSRRDRQLELVLRRRLGNAETQFEAWERISRSRPTARGSTSTCPISVRRLILP